MPAVDTNAQAEKRRFKKVLWEFVADLGDYISSESGDWSAKGFIDVHRNLYTISTDTKIVSKILEIHLFPKLLEFAESANNSIVLAEHQNWYPDLSFVSLDNEACKFAVDLKTTYRNPDYPDHVSGFTLGSHGAYFKDRTSTKNIQFPYSEYLGHFCLGIIYTRVQANILEEGGVAAVGELDGAEYPQSLNSSRVVEFEKLSSIASVIRDFEFFVCEKWELASDRQGSGNTANIGSITHIEDILEGRGVFMNLGEEWFDEYWMNYKVTSMMKDGKSVPITRIKDFVEFRGGDASLVNPMKTKKKRKN